MIPRRWRSEYPHIFPSGQTSSAGSESTHSIASVRPVTLSEVIFSAISEDAYAAASSDPSMLEDWLLDGEMILREGSTYTFPGETTASGSSPAGASLAYTLVMCAPVQQGVAVRGQTKLYVSAHPSADRDGAIPASDAIPDMVFDEIESEPSGSSNGDFEIGEDFLAGSVLRSLSINSLSSSASPSINGHLTNGDVPPGTTSESTGSGGLRLSSVEWTCRVHALPRPVSPVGDECAVYVRTADLGRIGVLDGDWVSCVLQTFHVCSF